MFLALRELKYAKLRYALIGLIMVLIAGLIFIISGLTKGLAADNASSIQNLQADYLVLEDSIEQQLNRSSIPALAGDDIKNIDGVKDASPLTLQMMSVGFHGSEQKLDVAMFATEANGMLVPPVAEGNGLDQDNGILIDSSLKREGVKIGDTLTAGNNNTELIVKGFVEGQRYSHTPVVFISEEIFYQMMGNNDDSANMVNAIALNFDETNGDAIQSKLSDDFVLTSKEEVLTNVPSYSQEQASLTMMIVFLFVISSFVLAAFFYVITLQKRDQFGVLKALGARTMYLIRSLVGQVLFLSVICIGLGILVTYGIKLALPAGIPFQLTAEGMMQYSLLILTMAVIGSLLSLFQIAKIDPVEAIEGGAN
ncbi:ABC transporter permease [Virgibacillus oceani]|uniref:Putative hemin transport system permease protein HrtB n=1 Tax=Virgibacillus oceani TaxID=1479511 RepID=A0A917M8Z8_9BACI|nr:ABC transporter permease [Virgibacillus oceani]GGG86855.1 ABC transporter permease [Virgibacillus oceani]